ncbi:hypothetical protein DUZ99_09920 [Xylanibacillus composti]|uniref:DUF2092 domain-containing protein n=1 Tax=Xylanibacillus composti TaxID=1572762 RepID=A0A8J4M4D2_9BACL|nr:hypothetical protein [Xylanibacillus composti]MDT9725288.1 hypothetical protein [Xylanibacillus composti]GIQ70491.1 hypothetical protein XYCOK13_33150 [Xylanibacillus composti]
MKKKSKVKVWMIGAAVVALSLFTVTAFASAPNTPGYDAFKEVLKANHQSGEAMESATVRGSFAVKVDGETVLKLGGETKVEAKGDKQSVSSDFDITLMGIERSGSMYSSDAETIYLVDRTHDLHYQVIHADHDHGSKQHEWRDERGSHHRSMNKAEEALLDYMAGDLKNEFSLEEYANGSKTITVDISKEELPLPVRLLMDVALAADKNERNHTPAVSAEWERVMELPFFQGFDQAELAALLPELTEDVAIERVLLQMTVDANNQVQSVQGKVEVSGKDEAGVIRRVEIEGAGELGGINATTPDMYDSAGKSIEVIDAAQFENRG